jgi:serine/threonine protein kinase
LSYASDIYSIGVTMIEVWTGEIWYDGEDFDSCRNEVLISLEKIIKKENELGKLLKRVIHLEEEKRPTATELMNELNKIRFY